MDSKKKLVSHLNYKIGQCLIKSKSSPIFKFNLSLSEQLFHKLKSKYNLTGRFKVCSNLEKDFKLINSYFYDEFTKDHHKIKDGSFMVYEKNKHKK